jgi:hypothetical protein
MKRVVLGATAMLVAELVGATLTALSFPASASHAATTASLLEGKALTHARETGLKVDARYRHVLGGKLAVAEATTTSVVESFTLLSANLQETRVVPADNGIYFAICPRGATCPYPAARVARPAADFLPRRLALELALRTLSKTSADVVAVSLPTPRSVLLVVEREDLLRELEVPALADALGGDPAVPPGPWLQAVVDKITRPRVFVALGLEPTPSGRETLGAMPRWPDLSSGN